MKKMIKCSGCSIKVEKEKAIEMRWFIVSDKICFCPNCDVTIIK